MQTITIHGRQPLHGSIRPAAAKNSALPLLAASLLCGGPCRLRGVPALADVDTSLALLQAVGADAQRCGADICTRPADALCGEIPDYLAGAMRSSVFYLAPLLCRVGYVRLPLPGGCRLGPRPVDIHLAGPAAMGAEVELEGIAVTLRRKGPLHGVDFTLRLPSVGATMTLLMAACCAAGQTVLRGAAQEPEIGDMIAFLSACGADIQGAGTPVLTVQGGRPLGGAFHRPLPDRIAAATYMAAAAVTGGTVLLRDVNSEHLLPVLSAFESTGCAVMQSGSELLLRAPQRLKPVRHVRTMPYPGFPTDAQAPVMTMAAVGDGTSIFVENIFESRYKHAGELNRLGAKIKLEGKVAVIEGVPQLSGAPVSAEDLRGGAALVLAAMQAEGESTIFGVKHIERGYDTLEAALQSVGARLKTVEIPKKM